MESAGKQPRPVKRPEVGDILDDAQQARIAARVGAQAARVRRVDIAAGRAGDEAVGDDLERRQQRLERRLAALDEMEHRAPRRARSKAGEPGKRLREGFEFGAGHGARDRNFCGGAP